MKKLIIIVVVVLIGAGLLRLSLGFEPVQDALLKPIGQAFVNLREPAPTSDAMRVYVCGSASPLGMSDQAQACIAVLTPDHFFLFDSGAGSTNNIARAQLVTSGLSGLFITHFHSDHIAEIYEVNLNSWVQGRPEPLTVYGPEGVDTLVSGINTTYALDRQYRSEHHGHDLLPPALGVLASASLKAGDVFEFDELKITAFEASHPPIVPAVGYRVDYKGRSVVISGDSNVTESTNTISKDVDLLLHDALSKPVVSTLSKAAAEAGADRISKIMADVIDYHASVDSLVELESRPDVVAYYHLVPVPVNALMEEFFERDMPSNYLIAKDGMWFELPVGSDDIIITEQ